MTWCALVMLLLPWSSSSQPSEIPVGTLNAPELDLSFEKKPSAHWNPRSKGCEVALDEQERHTGERSLRLTCDAQPDLDVGASISQDFPVEAVRGKNLRFSAYLRARGVSRGRGAALTFRVDGPHGLIAFDNMQFRRVTGSTDWTRYESSFDVPADTVRIVFGAALGSQGTVWLDSFGFEFGDLVEPPQAPAPGEPAPDEVVAWIRETAVPLETTRAESGFSDLAPLRELIGDARVVGLGEATHGTREFFQVKHRLFEFLVEEMGFTVFAIEANWPESSYVRDYVLGGHGDARTSIRNLAFPLWGTEEVHELVEWMRRYTADPARRRKLWFYGLDVQINPFALAPKVESYLERVDPEAVAGFKLLMDGWRKESIWSAGKRKRTVEELEELARRFDREKVRYIARAGELGWVLVRQVVVVLAQGIRIMNSSLAGLDDGRELRDEFMAANVDWILRTHGPDTRVVIWAHNGHIGKAPGSMQRPMGLHLASMLGEEYVALGIFFNRGRFQAFNSTRGPEDPGFIGRFEVAPAPPGYIGAAFARAGMPIFILDLRQRPKAGPVAEWLSTPQLTRQFGLSYHGVRTDEDTALPRQNLVELYDGVVFIEEMTRARPLIQ